MDFLYSRLAQESVYPRIVQLLQAALSARAPGGEATSTAEAVTIQDDTALRQRLLLRKATDAEA